MDKKTLNDITEKYDNTSPDQLRADLAVLTAINKRSGEILKIIKTAWEHDHDGGDKETVNIAGIEAGEISLGKGGNGKYTVTDERAYGALLHDNDFMIPGGKPAAEQVWMPRREAMDAKYLKDMIRDHGGELPDGVEWKPGRPGVVTFRSTRGFVDKLFSAELAPTIMRLLLTDGSENNTGKETKE